MSSPHEHAHDEEFRPEPSTNTFWLNVIGWTGVLFLFALIVAVTYLPTQGGDVDQAVIDQRLETRDEVLSTQHDLVSNYKVNADGSVRIPVDRAMQLVVDRLNSIPVEAVEDAEVAPPANTQTPEPEGENADAQEVKPEPSADQEASAESEASAETEASDQEAATEQPAGEEQQ